MTDVNSATGPDSAVLGSSIDVICNPGFYGGGAATCVAGSGPTAQMNPIAPCKREYNLKLSILISRTFYSILLKFVAHA